MDELERARLTQQLKEHLAALPPRPKRKYTKRPSGDVLAEMNRRHDASTNPWIRLALSHGDCFEDFT